MFTSFLITALFYSYIVFNLDELWPLLLFSSCFSINFLVIKHSDIFILFSFLHEKAFVAFNHHELGLLTCRVVTLLTEYTSLVAHAILMMSILIPLLHLGTAMIILSSTKKHNLFPTLVVFLRRLIQLHILHIH